MAVWQELDDDEAVGEDPLTKVQLTFSSASLVEKPAMVS